LKLQWHGELVAAPGYTVESPGTLLRVSQARPLLRIENAIGRTFDSPVRKSLRFLVVDGPAATYRKVKGKRLQRALTDDYHVVAISGHRCDTGEPALALACGVPAWAEYLPVHQALTVPADDAADIDKFAATLLINDDVLRANSQRNYIDSGAVPPAEFVQLVKKSALASLARPGRSSHQQECVPSERAYHDPEQSSLLAGAVGQWPGRSLVLMGAGDYARTEVLPAIARLPLTRGVIADREPLVASAVARAWGFFESTTDPALALERAPSGSLVAVTTAHDSHARLGASALRAGHKVFMTKPLVVTQEDLLTLAAAVIQSGQMPEVGFNRRYSSLTQAAERLMSQEEGPVTITCIVKEVDLSEHHWYHWPNQGTRISGNLCHWFDLGVLFTRAEMPRSVSLSSAIPGTWPDEERTVTVDFADGSVLTVVATSRGDEMLGVQERIELRRGGLTIEIDDFRVLTALKRGRRSRQRVLWRDKGQRRLLTCAFGRMLNGSPSPYRYKEFVSTSAIQLAATALAESDQLAGQVASLVPALEDVRRLQSSATEPTSRRD
jgi:predicted dehydrogenase